VSRTTWRALKVGVPLTLAAGAALIATSGSHAILLDVYLLCIGAVVLLALVRTTRAAVPVASASPFDQALAAMRAPVPESPEPELVRELELATYNSFHFHARVRPLLQDIAAHRLRARYGVELARVPARARELVGGAAWEVVRPDRPSPADRMAPGPTAAQLRTIVDELEAV
jgi:hypothetical protein